MKTSSYLWKVTFITPVLGSQPTKEVASEYLLAKAVAAGGLEPDALITGLPADELQSLPDVLEKGTTVFHRDQAGNPCLYDYQVKGFIKEAGRTFNGLRDVKNLRSKIDSYVFIEPRQIKLHIPKNGNGGYEIQYLERPLRAETAQGPRVALARSEMLPEGTWFECVVDILKGPIFGDLLQELLEYGERKGLGQWRNGGYGRFTSAWSELENE